MLWDPAAHEPLAGEWDEGAALAAIRAIVDRHRGRLRRRLAGAPGGRRPRTIPSAWSGTYLGSAGVVDALRRLAERGLVELQRDYLPYLETLGARRAGAGADARRDGHPARPPAAVAVRGEPRSPARARRRERRLRCRGSYSSAARGRCSSRASSASTTSGRSPPSSFSPTATRRPGLWAQNLWGRAGVHLGAAHGFAGCVLALGELDGAAEIARRYAIVEDGLANWPPSADGRARPQGDDPPPVVPRRARDDHRRWATRSTRTSRSPAASSRGGQARSRRAAGLCHGTAGNGYAFLELHGRTGDELWLDRARAFAAHAIGQVERRRAGGATACGRATSGSRSTSPTASRAAAAYRFRSSQSASDDEERDAAPGRSPASRSPRRS